MDFDLQQMKVKRHHPRIFYLGYISRFQVLNSSLHDCITQHQS